MTIAEFKNGLCPARRQYDVSKSLVGATLHHVGGQTRDQYTYDDGRTCAHPDGPCHDCAYVEARNRLIPAAEHHACLAMITAEIPPNRSPADVYTRIYLAEMSRLWAARATTEGP